MSKKDEKERLIKHCVFCGAKVGENQIYCPECGKLVLKIKDDSDKVKASLTQDTPIHKEKELTSRKCPGCGSIISSPVLEQCPICNAKLEKLSKQVITKSLQTTQKSSGFIFTNKKLVPEQKLVLKKDIWNLKEGITIFGNSLMAYITIRLLIIILLNFQTGLEINIFTILLSQIPELIFGVYPFWYIYSKKHSFRKLGFFSDYKKIGLAFIIGIIGGIGLYFVNNFSDFVIEFMYNSGIRIIDIPTYIAEQNQAIRDSEFIWILLLMVVLSLSVFSSELVFRGVLHNTLKEHFRKDNLGRIYVIIIVALIYSVLFLVFFLPVSIYFFIMNFLIAIVLGIIYEVNNNIYNTIIASILYNIFLVIVIAYF